MSRNKEVPLLRGEGLYVPFVGAIIEREVVSGNKEIVIQVRQKASDKVYSGTIEIPGGKMRAFEDIYETLRREVTEECGLDITSIQGEVSRVDISNRNDTSTLIEPFCVTQMQEGPFIGIIFICRGNGQLSAKTEEAKEARWIFVKDLAKIVKENPEKIYTANLAPLKKYLQQL